MNLAEIVDQATEAHKECIQRWDELRKKDPEKLFLTTMHTIEAHYPVDIPKCVYCGRYTEVSFIEHAKTSRHEYNKRVPQRR